MVVLKKPQPSQMVSKAQPSLAGLVHQPLPSIRRCSSRSRRIYTYPSRASDEYAGAYDRRRLEG